MNKNNHRVKRFYLMTAIVLALSLPAQTNAQNVIDQLLGGKNGGVRADDVPAGETGRYYLPGAAMGRDAISPSSYSSQFKLGANFRAGFSASCGDLDFFANFKAELKQMQHKLKNIIKDAQKALMASASGAVSSFFQYALMKINPTLGQLSTKALDEYIEVFDLKVKQCQDYERDLANGKNPLSEMVQIAVGDQWKTTIGLVNNGEVALEEAEKEMVKEAKKNGVQMADGKRYGGENQEPINITKSLIVAGMNLNLGRGDKGSWDGNFSTGDDAVKNNPILGEFKSAKELYEFVEDIYGSKESVLTDENNTGEEVNTTAGRGYEVKYTEYRNEHYKALKEFIAGKMDRKTFETQTGDIIPLSEVDEIRRMAAYPKEVEIEARAQRFAIERMRKNLLFAKQALKTGIYAPDLQQSAMKKPAEEEYKSVYYRIMDDIREIGQRAYQY